MKTAIAIFLGVTLFTTYTPSSATVTCRPSDLSRANRILETIAAYDYTSPVTPMGRDILFVEDLVKRGCLDQSKLPDRYLSLFIAKELYTARLREQQYWEDEYARLGVAAKYSPNALASEERELQLDWQKNGSSLVDPAPLAAQVSAIAKTGGAASCTSKNIAEKLGPVRDQDGAGWCFFYSCADILSKKLGRKISASQLGALISPTGTHGAGADDVNKVMRLKGLCPEEVARSDFTSEDFPATIKRVETLAQMDVNACLDRKILGQILGKALATSGIDWSTVPTGKHFLTHAIDRVCQTHRIDPGNVKLVEEWKWNMQTPREINLLAKIDLRLDQGDPVGIGYDIGKLLGGSNGGHVSVVVGRRFIDGECQYLVRNSWGPSSCQELVPQPDHCQPAGHFWVKAVDLIPQTTRVIYAQ